MFFLSPIQFSHVTKVEKRVKQFEVTAFALKWLLDAIFNIKVIWEKTVLACLSYNSIWKNKLGKKLKKLFA